MSNLVLYRKYRPRDFADVIGQDHVIKVLKGAIELGNIAHAYLFAGSRGTGKTSIARILARTLGCSANDLYEIDAASSRGIDEVRALREAVRTLPFDSPYKVYIIDEVHMMTKEAFNALLKTLEEPPEHVIFVLATTEVHKLPETVVSRCQNFDFKKPNLAELGTFILRVLKGEGFTTEKGVIELIALLADGSFRDAAGILQKTISASSDKKIVLAEVERVTGAPNQELVQNFVRALVSHEAGAALSVIKDAVARDSDMKTFVKLVLRFLRLALLLKLAPKLVQEMGQEMNEREWALVEELARSPRVRELPQMIKELLYAYDDIDRFYLPHLAIELVAVKITNG